MALLYRRHNHGATVDVECPICGEEVRLEVGVKHHPAEQATAYYPGAPAHTEVWGEGSACRCGHYLEVDDHEAAIIAALEEQ